MSYYKSLSLKEKAAEAEKKKIPQKRAHSLSAAMQLQQKYGISSALRSRKHVSLAASPFPLRVKEQIKEVVLKPSKTVGLDEIEKLPDDIYTKPVDFTQMTSVEQRLDQPSLLFENVTQLTPRRSTMFIKRALRCKTCDHNIIKPEFNASAIKFKINWSAIQHVPEVRINKLSPLSPGKKSKITLSMINPTENVMNVTFLPHIEEEKKRCNAQVDLPTENLVLSRYDDVAEYGEVTQVLSEEKDNPEIVAFRSANKLGFYVDVTPDPDLPVDTDVWITFSFKFDHYDTVTITQILRDDESKRKLEVKWLKQTVYINLGKMKA